ncbi:MAG TPA: tRNA guanosine(34) transglycosylase Tgt, partial [Pyrinomonadaceae bacterium]|nr:tRNA guanosine(34) transglycosylase Tgt [Pyrinomonadaceae bacterium]
LDVIRAAGGLHKFINWDKPILTDSGGFQVFSLAKIRKIKTHGVEFRSHLDGSLLFLGPKEAMDIQRTLGSDIAMVFDECPPGDAGVEATRKSLELTSRWARRSKDRFDELQATGMDSGYLEVNGSGITQALFGIVQGAGHLELRTESLERTVEIGFDGYAIGGLSVGEEKSVMYEVLDHLAPKMPADAPRYLMGVGTPEDLIEGVNCGVDMFDCVIPTRNGRTGSAFTSRGKLNIRNAKFARNDGPLDPECTCSVCKRYSLGYLRHLYQVGEMNAAILISHHNVAFFLNTMRSVRAAIKDGEFQDFRRKFLEGLKANGAESV